MESDELSSPQLNNILTYINILIRWNARMNLTSIREPEEIVTRHFGESLFAARHLAFPRTEGAIHSHVVDVGSGAGFPGIPIKIWSAEIHLTLIESNTRKATYLREVCRELKIKSADVFGKRAEEFAQKSGDMVIMRAVEKFDIILLIAEGLVKPSGRLALLISEVQIPIAKRLSKLAWQNPIRIPMSAHKVLLIGKMER
jgi:16S rRNA (guanine527-N7)-methyltransferase